MDGTESAKSLMPSIDQIQDMQKKQLCKNDYMTQIIKTKCQNLKNNQNEIKSQTHNTIQKRKKKCINKKIRKSWTVQEDLQLKRCVQQYGSNWFKIASSMINRNPSQCIQRWKRIKPQTLKKRNPFSEEEDSLILQLVTKYKQNWTKIAFFLPGRTNKQIRERYINKLNPENNFEPFTEIEDQIILKAYQEIGSKWTKIQELLVGRPENMIKNRFYSYLRQKFLKIKNPYYQIPAKNVITNLNQKCKMETQEQFTKEKQLKETDLKQEHSNKNNNDIQVIYTQQLPLEYNPYPYYLFSYHQYYFYQVPATIVYIPIEEEYTNQQNNLLGKQIYINQQETKQA